MMISLFGSNTKLLLAPLLLLGFATYANAQQGYASPAAAADALAAAAKGDDQNAMLGVLGSGAKDIVSSGDDIEDAAARQRFLGAYDEKQLVVDGGDKKAVVTLGNEDYPFPL